MPGAMPGGWDPATRTGRPERPTGGSRPGPPPAPLGPSRVIGKEETTEVETLTAAPSRGESMALDVYARQLPVARRRAWIRPERDLVLPSFQGALWHSVLGGALKELVCTVPPGVCRGCPRWPECEYPRVVESESPPGAAGPLGGGMRVPGPLVLDTGAWGAVRVPAGERFPLDFALIGADPGLTAAVEAALEVAGGRGLGRARVPAKVIEIDPRPGLAEILDRVAAAPSSTVRLRLVTPLRLRRGGVPLRRLDLGALARDLSLRLAATGHYHAGLPWPAPWVNAFADAERATIREGTTGWRESVRYSARQDREIVVGGLVGEVTLDNVGPDLARLLTVGSVIHAGKGTSMGLGQIDVDTVGVPDPAD
jgi:hypothetical protein